MAHRGKFWKVAFRRDLRPQNRENVIGWPEAFLMSVAFLNRPKGLPLNNVPVRVLCLTKSPGPPLVWTSDPTPIAGDVYVYEFTVDTPFDSEFDPTTMVHWRISHSTGDVIRDDLRETIGPGYEFGGIRFTPPAFVDPLYSDPAHPVGWNTTRMEWASYNPPRIP